MESKTDPKRYQKLSKIEVKKKRRTRIQNGTPIAIGVARAIDAPAIAIPPARVVACPQAGPPDFEAHGLSDCRLRGEACRDRCQIYCNAEELNGERSNGKIMNVNA